MAFAGLLAWQGHWIVGAAIVIVLLAGTKAGSTK
jgi:hypothetical protein